MKYGIKIKSIIHSWIVISFREQYVPKTCKFYTTEVKFLDRAVLRSEFSFSVK